MENNRSPRSATDASSPLEEGVTAYPLPPGYPFPTVFTGIAAKDAMLHAGVARQYYDVGVSAIRCIEEALAVAGKSEDTIGAILDLPCGHGRVGRVLRVRFPQASLTACDIDPDGVAFCVRHLQAQGVASRRDFRAVRLGRTFDLIWVGSLITHLPRWLTERFLHCACGWLAPGGLLVVSNHGRRVADWIGKGLAEKRHHAASDPSRQALRDFEQAGYGFFASHQKGWNGLLARLLPSRAYGTSLIARSWLEGLALPGGRRVLAYREHAWADFHDIVVIGDGTARERLGGDPIPTGGDHGAGS